MRWVAGRGAATGEWWVMVVVVAVVVVGEVAWCLCGDGSGDGGVKAYWTVAGWMRGR